MHPGDARAAAELTGTIAIRHRRGTDRPCGAGWDDISALRRVPIRSKPPPAPQPRMTSQPLRSIAQICAHHRRRSHAPSAAQNGSHAMAVASDRHTARPVFQSTSVLPTLSLPTAEPIDCASRTVAHRTSGSGLRSRRVALSSHANEDVHPSAAMYKHTAGLTVQLAVFGTAEQPTPRRPPDNRAPIRHLSEDEMANSGMAIGVCQADLGAAILLMPRGTRRRPCHSLMVAGEGVDTDSNGGGFQADG